MKKITIPAVALAALALAGCATVSTPPDMVAVAYSGGATQSQSFIDCIEPSTRDWGGISDSYYQYPASQRYWSFDTANADTGPITFVTADGIEMSVTGVVNFNLNTECDTLRQFHEKIGNRNAAYFTDQNTPEGWNKTLALYVGQPLNTAVDRAGQKYKYTALYNDTATKTQWENEVLELLPGLVDRQTDGDEQFFQNFSITLQKPEPPASIKEALVEQQAAVARADAAKAEADARVAAAEAQVAVEKAEAEKAKPWVDLLGEDGYIEKLMTEKGLNPRQPGGNILNQTEQP
jgi:regulator of protease activity HflC (stomatin/prohibitin superfamily)